MLKYWLHLLSFLIFPAFATTALVSGSDGGSTPDIGADSGVADEGSSDATVEGETETVESADLGDETATDQPKQQPKEEPQLQNFKTLVSARVRDFTKKAPELRAIFEKHPDIQQEIEARFRRDAAYREVFPTVAEAHQMREKFPNGLADVEALEEDLAGVEELDNHFYQKDRDGNYPGHPQLIENMFKDDRQAAVALFKSLPKQWASLDRDSYNEVMGKVVGATFVGSGIPEFVTDIRDAAKDAKQDGLAGSLDKLLNWMNGYLKEKPRPSAEEERIQRDRQELDRQRANQSQQDQQRFNASFLSSSKKLQQDIIGKHPAIARLAKAQGVTPEKRARIIEEVRGKVEKFLGNSPSFMRKLRPAYESGKLDETLQIQQAAWSQQWLLNRMVRDVLRVETPALVTQSRESAVRRGAPAKKTVTGSQTAKPTGPQKVNGVWYKADGSRFSTAEIMAGKHLGA